MAATPPPKTPKDPRSSISTCSTIADSSYDEEPLEVLKTKGNNVLEDVFMFGKGDKRPSEGLFNMEPSMNKSIHVPKISGVAKTEHSIFLASPSPLAKSIPHNTQQQETKLKDQDHQDSKEDQKYTIPRRILPSSPREKPASEQRICNPKSTTDEQKTGVKDTRQNTPLLKEVQKPGTTTEGPDPRVQQHEQKEAFVEGIRVPFTTEAKRRPTDTKETPDLQRPEKIQELVTVLEHQTLVVAMKQQKDETTETIEGLKTSVGELKQLVEGIAQNLSKSKEEREPAISSKIKDATISIVKQKGAVEGVASTPERIKEESKPTVKEEIQNHLPLVVLHQSATDRQSRKPESAEKISSPISKGQKQTDTAAIQHLPESAEMRKPLVSVVKQEVNEQKHWNRGGSSSPAAPVYLSARRIWMKLDIEGLGWLCGCTRPNGLSCRNPVGQARRANVAYLVEQLSQVDATSSSFEDGLKVLAVGYACHHHRHGLPFQERLQKWKNRLIPVVDTPRFEPPVFRTPVLKAAAIEAPVVKVALLVAPIVKEPIVEEIIIEEPVIEEPVAEKPAVKEPAVEEPAAEEPVLEQPACGESAPVEAVLDETLAEEPVTEKSLIIKLDTEEVLAPKPLAEGLLLMNMLQMVLLLMSLLLINLYLVHLLFPYLSRIYLIDLILFCGSRGLYLRIVRCLQAAEAPKC